MGNSCVALNVLMHEERNLDCAHSMIVYSIIILKVFANEVVVRVIDFTVVIKQVGHCMHMTSDLNSFRDVTTYAKEKKDLLLK